MLCVLLPIDSVRSTRILNGLVPRYPGMFFEKRGTIGRGGGTQRAIEALRYTTFRLKAFLNDDRGSLAY